MRCSGCRETSGRSERPRCVTSACLAPARLRPPTPGQGCPARESKCPRSSMFPEHCPVEFRPSSRTKITEGPLAVANAKCEWKSNLISLQSKRENSYVLSMVQTALRYMDRIPVGTAQYPGRQRRKPLIEQNSLPSACSCLNIVHDLSYRRSRLNPTHATRSKYRTSSSTDAAT